MTDVSIRPARPGEGGRLHAIEMAAGMLFRDIGMDAIAEAPATPAQTYDAFIARGQGLVADHCGRPVAFLAWEPRDARHFIYELSVHPDHQGNRIGAQLIRHMHRPTLSCFTDVPWNKPYYERLGFVVADPHELGPAHAAIAKEEARRFAPWPRCIMMMP